MRFKLVAKYSGEFIYSFDSLIEALENARMHSHAGMSVIIIDTHGLLLPINIDSGN